MVISQRTSTDDTQAQGHFLGPDVSATIIIINSSFPDVWKKRMLENFEMAHLLDWGAADRFRSDGMTVIVDVHHPLEC